MVLLGAYNRCGEAMSIKKPFYRNCRQFVDGTYASGGKSYYILDRRYAEEPEQYIRAFLLLQKDLQNLFEYIDTCDTNLSTYSFRTHELLLRGCIEVEANCKAILKSHGYTSPQKKFRGDPEKMDMWDYKKLESTHLLSQYYIKIPHWRGEKSLRQPFKSWELPNRPNPSWYEAYHEVKHNRYKGFENANFENVIDSICGLLVLLSSQFYTHEFSSGSCGLGLGGYGPNNGTHWEVAIGNYFRVKFPEWPKNEQYGFTYQDWKAMAEEDSPFQYIDYKSIT